MIEVFDLWSIFLVCFDFENLAISFRYFNIYHDLRLWIGFLYKLFLLEWLWAAETVLVLESIPLTEVSVDKLKTNLAINKDKNVDRQFSTA